LCPTVRARPESGETRGVLRLSSLRLRPERCMTLPPGV